jgi:acetylornithine deacetylase/succinyl-diaminopimelate desuccinylase-like protein
MVSIVVTQRWIRAQPSDEATRLLTAYVSIDTSNPPGDTRKAADFLAGLFERDGIAVTRYESAPGKAIVYARLKATVSPPAGKPILLLHHMDVVPADRTQWKTDPFVPTIQGNELWARGAMDMKGQGIAQVLAFLRLKRERVPLNRDVILLAEPDEEVGGTLGARWMIANHYAELDPEFVIDEGGFGSRDLFAPGKLVYGVAVAEKKIVWLKLRAEGVAGHGSQPTDQNPNDRLVKALARLLASDGDPKRVALQPSRGVALQQTDVALQQTDVALQQTDVGLQQTDVALRQTDVALRQTDVGRPFQGRREASVLDMMQAKIGTFAQNKFTNAIQRSTISLTWFRSGVGDPPKINVIPSVAEAGLDCRVLPGTSKDQWIAEIKRRLGDPSIAIELINESDDPIVTTPDSPLFRNIEAAIRRRHPDAVVSPILIPYGTDSNAFRPKGVKSYGIFPAILSAETVASMHGDAERVPLDGVAEAVQVFFEALRDTLK